MFLSKFFSASNHPYLKGHGGRFQNNKPMQGMSMTSLGKHPALMPLHAAVMLFGSLVFIIGYHNITKSGVNWRKVKDQTEYDDYTSKFFNWEQTLAELEKEETRKRPDYKPHYE